MPRTRNGNKATPNTHEANVKVHKDTVHSIRAKAAASNTTIKHIVNDLLHTALRDEATSSPTKDTDSDQIAPHYDGPSTHLFTLIARLTTRPRTLAQLLATRITRPASSPNLTMRGAIWRKMTTKQLNRALTVLTEADALLTTGDPESPALYMNRDKIAEIGRIIAGRWGAPLSESKRFPSMIDGFSTAHWQPPHKDRQLTLSTPPPPSVAKAATDDDLQQAVKSLQRRSEKQHFKNEAQHRLNISFQQQLDTRKKTDTALASDISNMIQYKLDHAVRLGAIHCASLTVVDEDGNRGVALRTDEYGGVVYAFGNDGKIGAALRNEEDGGVVGAYGKDGKSEVQLTNDEKGGLMTLCDKSGRPQPRALHKKLWRALCQVITK